MYVGTQIGIYECECTRKTVQRLEGYVPVSNGATSRFIGYRTRWEEGGRSGWIEILQITTNRSSGRE